MSNINEITLLTSLYDIYSSLLTDKQRNIFEKYYFYNLSLKEISEELNISRNGVLDSLEHTKTKLLSFEDNLSFYKKIKKIEELDIPEDLKEKILEVLK